MAIKAVVKYGIRKGMICSLIKAFLAVSYKKTIAELYL